MIEILKTKYPDFNFLPGERYSWSSDTKTIYYPSGEEENINHHSLLHELAHALLNHNGYKNDIDLIKIERDAWSLTKKLLSSYGLDIDADHIEDCLDTYRDWIYKRSKCLRCSHSGYQCDTNSYACVFCAIKWSVPESRLCTVKRSLASL